MAIFSLLAKLGLDGTAFETGLKRSQSMAKGIGREISGSLAGMFAVDKIAEFGARAIETAGKLNDLSTRLGVSVEFLQEMQFAAEQSGASLEDVAGAVEKISIARMKALAGDQATIENFAKMGISMQQIKEFGGEGLFKAFGKSFESGIDPQKLVGPFRELAGRGAGSLIPAMAEGLDQAAEKARNLGLVMSNEVVASLDEFNDRVDTMKKGLEAAVGTIIADFGAPLLRQLDALGAGIQGFFGAMFDPGRAGFQIDHWFEQFSQSRRTALDEMDAEAEEKKADRQRREEMRAKSKIVEQQTAFKTVAVSASTGDQLARTGGFTAFQSNMDRYFGNVRTQAQDIRDIAKNTKRTADAVQE
jgi:hypothetical protein